MGVWGVPLYGVITHGNDICIFQFFMEIVTGHYGANIRGIYIGNHLQLGKKCQEVM